MVLMVTKSKKVKKLGCLGGWIIDGMTNMNLILADMSEFTQTLSVI